MFKIDVTDFTWINGPEDDPKDLCLHGKVTAHIEDEVLEDQGTVSASALYLLRSLTTIFSKKATPPSGTNGTAEEMVKNR